MIGETFKCNNGETLTIVGIAGYNSSRNKVFILECSKCSLDEELFPYGSITNLKGNLKKGQRPCACGKIKWKPFQDEIRMRRLAEERGYQFLGFAEKHQGFRTKLHLRNCVTGHEWKTTSINNFLKGHGDPENARKNTIEASVKPDKVFLDRFWATGKFLPDTVFERLSNSDWKFTCPECGTSKIGAAGGFERGQTPCDCNGTTFGYKKTSCANLYLVRWFGYGESYLKFGITNNSVQERVDNQDRKNKLDYEILRTWHNESGQLVWDCERDIIANMQTHACTKELMPDGYTETVEDTPENMETLLSIITKHLGE